MAMPAEATAPVVWTRAYVLDLIDRTPENWIRYELVDGELIVAPAPAARHQIAHSRLFGLLIGYVDRHGLGVVLSSPADISLDPGRKSLLQPNLFVVPRGGTWPPRSWRDIATLVLVIEILSPSTARHDRTLKRHYYQRNGVPDYWVVDLDRRRVERWRPDDAKPEIVRDQLLWQPDSALPPLVIDLPTLFREVLGDG
jgi:Uma2 family endonuclease